jgi:2-polyprenyl-3-methyl-5-hydroxy-6-metoxy-1,4-benzoquinol methylase
MKNQKSILSQEAEAFDNIVDSRLKKGFIPDIKISKSYNFFYNNPWRNEHSRKYSIDSKIKFVKKEIKKKDNVLEIGCGLGTLSYEIARTGANITGIDISKKSIDYCNFHKNRYLGNSKKINFLNISLDDMFGNSENYSFDKIVFFKTLHHIPRLPKVFKNLKKIMHKNSKIIIVEPVRKNFNIENAIFSYLIRFLADTWILKSKKLKNISLKSIEKDIAKIYDEYKYFEKNKKQQSPLDNISDDFEIIQKYLKINFVIEKINFEDAFKDKILGGIRGPNLKKTISFINNFDNYLIKNKYLKGATVKIIAKYK